MNKLVLSCLGLMLWALPAFAQVKEVPAYVAHGGIGFSIQEKKTDPVVAYDLVAAYDYRQIVVADCDSFKAELKGVTWCFANEANLIVFKKATKKRSFEFAGVTKEGNHYLPLVGGWCAWGQSNGNPAPGDPRTAFVYKGKLIVNGNFDVADAFKLNAELRMLLAEARYEAHMSTNNFVFVPNKPNKSASN